MAKEIKDFREFLDLLRDMRGIATWVIVATSASIGPATVDRIIADEPYSMGTKLEKRDAMARSLGFTNWWELVKAWEKCRGKNAEILLDLLDESEAFVTAALIRFAGESYDWRSKASAGLTLSQRLKIREFFSRTNRESAMNIDPKEGMAAKNKRK